MPPPLRIWEPELRTIRENTWKYLCLTGFTFNVSGDLRIHVLNEKIQGKRVFTYLTLNARISRLTRSFATKISRTKDCRSLTADDVEFLNRLPTVPAYSWWHKLFGRLCKKSN